MPLGHTLAVASCGVRNKSFFVTARQENLVPGHVVAAPEYALHRQCVFHRVTE
jgi:hypothetical protein